MTVIGVGIDLVDVDRFRRVLRRTPTLMERVFTEDEVAYSRKQVDFSRRLAARWAAKEATLKSLGLGLGGMRLRDIEVVRDSLSGQPRLYLHDRADRVAKEHGVNRFELSMSHTDNTAGATVIAL